MLISCIREKTMRLVEKINPEIINSALFTYSGQEIAQVSSELNLANIKIGIINTMQTTQMIPHTVFAFLVWRTLWA